MSSFSTGILLFVILAIWCKTSFTFLCRKDSLRITDGMGKTLGMYCGNKTGQNLLVTGEKVEMTFRSNDKVEQTGYYLVFTLVSPGKWDHKNVYQVYQVYLLKIPKILFLRRKLGHKILIEGFRAKRAYIAFWTNRPFARSGHMVQN